MSDVGREVSAAAVALALLLGIGTPAEARGADTPSHAVCSFHTGHRVGQAKILERCEAPPDAGWRSRRVRRNWWLNQAWWDIPAPGEP